ncbi:hypothetical protein CHCC14600_3988 [Bacillus licheniformis]|nr:hypothetical protein B4092_4188 [Bacillus licheniformis]KYC78039.1 hypothetical protein B4090_4207 [Bacillus licheniformis]KYC85382.1 hypothetical protein B4091_4233 [Bacillus licheniformis]KYC95057.1 hypothetical protein B4164_3975 [Bacillus licheniformis]OLG04403.1 hypothetical protein B4124_2323 [Bacillus licheniformis]
MAIRNFILSILSSYVISSAFFPLSCIPVIFQIFRAVLHKNETAGAK